MAIDRTRQSGYVPLRQAIDQLFEGSVLSPGFFGTQAGFPSSDVYVTDEDVVVCMSIPGARPDDINVSVTGDTVTIGGEVRHQHTSQKHQPYIQEIWQGKFQRSFQLPVQVDANKAEASFENGVLVLTLPKSEATKPRKIQVKQQQQTIQGESQQAGQGTTQTETVPVQSGSSS